MSIKKFNGTNNTASLENLVTFLNANKSGTFLENYTIEARTPSETGWGKYLYINDGTNTFEHWQLSAGSVTPSSKNSKFTAPHMTMEIPAGANAVAYVYINSAILCNNGLMLNMYTSGQSTNFIGCVMLTADNSGKLVCIFRVANYSSSNANTHNLRIANKDSAAASTVTLTPSFGQQLTALIPVAISTINDGSIAPAFFTSLQTQLPSLGLQAGRMDSNDYITNGYCFIRE